MRKITKKDIDKNNMVALSYCQCQKVLTLFGGNYKIGYNSGIYGWNYDLYNVHGVSIVTGYRFPYAKYSNNDIKKKLISLENKIKMQNLSFAEYTESKKEWRKEFLKIFE